MLALGWEEIPCKFCILTPHRVTLAKTHWVFFIGLDYSKSTRDCHVYFPASIAASCRCQGQKPTEAAYQNEMFHRLPPLVPAWEFKIPQLCVPRPRERSWGKGARASGLCSEFSSTAAKMPRVHLVQHPVFHCGQAGAPGKPISRGNIPALLFVLSIWEGGEEEETTTTEEEEEDNDDRGRR